MLSVTLESCGTLGESSPEENSDWVARERLRLL